MRAKSLIYVHISDAEERAIRLGLSKRDIDLVGRLEGVNKIAVQEARSSASIRKIIDDLNPGSTWRSSRNTVPRLIGHANDFLHDSIGQRAQSASFLRDGVLRGRNNIPTSFAETVSFMGIPASITVFGRLSFYNEWVKTWSNEKHVSK